MSNVTKMDLLWLTAWFEDRPELEVLEILDKNKKRSILIKDAKK